MYHLAICSQHLLQVLTHPKAELPHSADSWKFTLSLEAYTCQKREENLKKQTNKQKKNHYPPEFFLINLWQCLLNSLPTHCPQPLSPSGQVLDHLLGTSQETICARSPPSWHVL